MVECLVDLMWVLITRYYLEEKNLSHWCYCVKTKMNQSPKTGKAWFSQEDPKLLTALATSREYIHKNFIDSINNWNFSELFFLLYIMHTNYLFSLLPSLSLSLSSFSPSIFSLGYTWDAMGNLLRLAIFARASDGFKVTNFFRHKKCQDCE